MYMCFLDHRWMATGEIPRTNALQRGHGDGAIKEEPQLDEIRPLAQRRPHLDSVNVQLSDIID